MSEYTGSLFDLQVQHKLCLDGIRSKGNAVIALDMDGVKADLLTPWLADYNSKYGDSLTNEMITEWEVHKFVKPECGEKVYEFIYNNPHVYDDVKPMEHSQEAVQNLIDLGHTVIIATKATNNSTLIGAKYKWLRENFPMISPKNYIFIQDKRFVRADILVDDGHHNLTHFEGLPILMDAPYNRDVHDYLRVYNLKDLVNLLK